MATPKECPACGVQISFRQILSHFRVLSCRCPGCGTVLSFGWLSCVAPVLAFLGGAVAGLGGFAVLDQISGPLPGEGPIVMGKGGIVYPSGFRIVCASVMVLLAVGTIWCAVVLLNV